MKTAHSPIHDAKHGGESTGSRPYYRANMASLSAGNNVGLLIRCAFTSITRAIDLNVAPLGLTAMQWRPLVMIRHKGIDTPAELARHSGVDTGAMTRTIDRLEAKGFLTRRRCTDDRRVVKLELTETGHAAADNILPAVAAALNSHITGFTNDEVQLLCSLLQRVIANGGADD